MGLLSMMRGDSQALDRRLTALQDRLSLCEKEIRDLEREAAAMMSPRQVHAYALKELGMTQVHLAGAIRIDGIGNADLTATAQLLGKGRVYTNN